MPRQAEHFYQRLDQCYAQGDLQAVEQNMGRVYEAMGRRKEAMDCLARAKGVYERLFGPEDQRTRSAAGELRRLQEEHPL